MNIDIASPMQQNPRNENVEQQRLVRARQNQRLNRDLVSIQTTNNSVSMVQDHVANSVVEENEEGDTQAVGVSDLVSVQDDDLDQTNVTATQGQLADD